MDMNERKKTKTKGISQWVPEFVYWNIRLMSQQWNQSQSSIIEEGVLSWMDKNRLKTPDWFKENPTELSLLLKELNGQTYFKDEKFSLKEFNPIRISVNKRTALHLNIASKQTRRPMSAILIESLLHEMEAVKWIFLSVETAKERCLMGEALELTGEMVDSSEGERLKTDDFYDKLYFKLEKKGLVKEGQKYNYDDLLSIKSQNKEVEELSPEIESEVSEAITRINALLGKKGGDT